MHSETNRGGAQADEKTRWHNRTHGLIVVAAPEEVKIARFIARSASGQAITTERRAKLEAEARRLAQQISDDQKSALAD